LCFLWHEQFLFVRLIKKKYAFYCNIGKKYRNISAQIVWRFAHMFDKSKLLRMRFTPNYYVTAIIFGIWPTFSHFSYIRCF